MAGWRPLSIHRTEEKNQMANESFRQAYSVLRRHAQTLRDQREPNIDDLLTVVTEPVQAYKVC